MSKTYEEGYRDGFRDGHKAALERDEGTRATPAPTLRGCQCPPGAEIGCQSSGCGRRSIAPVYLSTATLNVEHDPAVQSWA
jgi:hypothetical protein